MGAWFALALLTGAGLMLVVRHDATIVAGLDNSQVAGIVAAVALLIFLAGAVSGSYRGRLAQALQDMVTWVAIALLLIAGYTYREELLPYAQRIAGELVPGTPVMVETETPEGQGVRIRRQWDGHFVANVNVNDVSVRMIVDTGASTVVLRPQDARKLGIDPDRLVYSVPVQTANGQSHAARVRLDKIAIGPLVYHKVEALVARPDSVHQSLLGMSFLSRLRSYEFSGDFLTLRS